MDNSSHIKVGDAIARIDMVATCPTLAYRSAEDQAMSPSLSIPLFLAKSSRASVRLVNAVLRAVDESPLPFSSVEEYVAAGSNARKKMSATPHFGQKLLDELDRLLMEAGTDAEQKPSN